ncbi:MAG TPA: PA14 domain-containing protein, partial [Chthoniobacterales bacterium]|nr:PA14 domain-containing protein [Chthoniobacterales bacterium]
MNCRPLSRHGALLTAAALFACSGVMAHAQIDRQVDRTIWQMLYGLTDAQVDAINSDIDTDADGLPDSAELIAGTNPLRTDSTLAVRHIAVDATEVHITFASVPGKRYALESASSPGTSEHRQILEHAIEVDGTGDLLTLRAHRGTNQFHRVAVRDLDSDGDRVSDWAEIITGFDANSTHSNGATIDDHTALTNALLKENVVSITASEPSAVQPSDAVSLPLSPGAFTVTRAGTINFSSITVPLTRSGTAFSDIDFVALPTSVTFPPEVSAVKVLVTPKFNSARQNNATVTLTAEPGGGYTVAPPSSASVVISPTGNATGTGLTGHYYNSTSAEINAGYNAAALFNAADLRLTRNDATVDFTWNNTSPGPGVNATYYVVRWLGQVQPQYSETYYFLTRTNDGVKLWVNGQLLIDKWSNQAGIDNIAAIDLKAGVLYDIKLEYYQATGNGEARLSWYSQNQVRQIIPTNRLYPASAGAASSSITCALQAYGFVGQPFSFMVTASNSANVLTTFALGAGSGPLPAGLSLNPSTGLISGTPTQAGVFQVALIATNSLGVGSSVLRIEIIDSGNAITREVWTSGVSGAAVRDIPLHLPPKQIDNDLNTLEDSAPYPDGT